MSALKSVFPEYASKAAVVYQANPIEAKRVGTPQDSASLEHFHSR